MNNKVSAAISNTLYHISIALSVLKGYPNTSSKSDKNSATSKCKIGILSLIMLASTGVSAQILDLAAPSMDLEPPCTNLDCSNSAQTQNLPLRTQGKYVVDANGERFVFRSVNWAGAHTGTKVPSGLESVPLHKIVQRIKEIGFNSVRLTFANQMLHDQTKPNPRWVGANPQLENKTSFEVFQAVVKALTDEGIVVSLNNHTSNYTWCCNPDDWSALWWNPHGHEYYNEPEDWVNDWKTMANTFANNKYAVGYDLRNEIRQDGILDPRSAHWNGWVTPTNKQDSRNDWKLWSEKAAQAILNITDHALIIVEGINQSSHLFTFNYEPAGEEWVSNRPQLRTMIPIKNRFTLAGNMNRFVYAAHAYPFTRPLEPTGYKYKKIREIYGHEGLFELYDQEWGSLPGYAGVPVLLSEFGAAWKEADNEDWLESAAEIMEEKATAGFQYWSLAPYRYFREFNWLNESWQLNTEAIMGPDFVPRKDYRTSHLDKLFPGLELHANYAQPIAKAYRVGAYGDANSNEQSLSTGVNYDWAKGYRKLQCKNNYHLAGIQFDGRQLLCVKDPDNWIPTTEGGPSEEAWHSPTDGEFGKMSCPSGQIPTGYAWSEYHLQPTINRLFCRGYNIRKKYGEIIALSSLETTVNLSSRLDNFRWGSKINSNIGGIWNTLDEAVQCKDNEFIKTVHHWRYWQQDPEKVLCVAIPRYKQPLYN